MSNRNQRFLIFALLHFLALGIITAVNFDTVQYPKLFLFWGIATIVWGGFEHDYSLRDNQVFFNFLLLSMVFLLAGGFLQKLNFVEAKDIYYVVVSSRLLIVYLLSQRILRFLFLKIMKYEPELYIHGNKFPDAIYSFILLMVMVGSGIAIAEQFKFFS